MNATLTDENATSKTRVVIKRVPNPLARSYNVAAELSKQSIADFRLPTIGSEYEMSSIGDVACKLLRDIEAAVPGVETLYIYRYSLTVFINRAFSWDDIEPKILDAIAKAVGTELDVSTE
jgi:hypothetical protein